MGKLRHAVALRTADGVLFDSRLFLGFFLYEELVTFLLLDQLRVDESPLQTRRCRDDLGHGRPF